MRKKWKRKPSRKSRDFSASLKTFKPFHKLMTQIPKSMNSGVLFTQLSAELLTQCANFPIKSTVSMQEPVVATHASHQWTVELNKNDDLDNPLFERKSHIFVKMNENFKKIQKYPLFVSHWREEDEKISCTKYKEDPLIKKK